MAIQLQSLFNAPGLGALASKDMPNLQLQANPIDVGAPDKGLAAGMLVKAQADNELMKQQQQAQLMQVLEQYKQQQMTQRDMAKEQMKGQYGLAREGVAGENAMAREQLRAGVDLQGQADTRDYRQQQLGMEEQKLGVDAFYKQVSAEHKQEEIMQKQIMDSFTMKMKMKDSDLEAQSNVLGGYLFTTMSTKDPTVLKKAQNTAINLMSSQGIITKELAEQLRAASPEEFMPYAAMQSKMTEKAITAKGSGIKLVTSKDADGNETTTFSIGGQEDTGLTTPVKTETQKDLINLDGQIRQLEQAGTDYSKDYLTYVGAAKGIIGNMMSSAGLENSYTEFSKNKQNFSQNLNRLTFEFMKQMSGVQYSNTQLEAMRKAIVNTSNSPAEFEGNMKSMLNYIRASIDAKNELIKSGIKLDNSPKAKAAFEERLSNILGAVETKNSQYTPGQTYVDGSGKKAVYQEDGSWREI